MTSERREPRSPAGTRHDPAIGWGLRRALTSWIGVSVLGLTVLTGPAVAGSTRPGRFAVATPSEDAITVAASDGSGYEVVTHRSGGAVYSPTWSPDGRRLAYLSFDTAVAQVHVVSLRSGADHAVATLPFLMDDLTWSPSGDWLAFQTYNNWPEFYCWGCGVSASQTVYLVHPDGTGLTPVLAAGALPGSPTWSPDGRRLAFATEVGVSSVDVTTPGVATPMVTGYRAQYPVWSPDGRHLVFVGDPLDDPAGLIQPQHLDVVTVATGEVKQLPLQSWDKPSWSPDGRMLAVDATGAGLVISDVAGRRIRPLAAGHLPTYQPAWSPDNRIGFLTPAGPRGEIVVATVRPDGSQVRLLTANGGYIDASPFIAWTRH